MKALQLKLAVNNMPTREALEQKKWEAKFDQIPFTSRITQDNYALLEQVLRGLDDNDSYLTSLNYYLYTGRKGLWLYKNGGQFVIVCWHPNIQNKILLFLHNCQNNQAILHELLGFIPQPSNGILVARNPSDDNEDRSSYLLNRRKITMCNIEEKALDWQYPVHILSTSSVAGLIGSKYMNIRNRIRQLKNYKIEALPFDALHHSRAIENLFHRWAQKSAIDPTEYENLYAPYESLLMRSIADPSLLSGLMIFVDGALHAVGLWDVSNASSKTANLFINLCSTDFKGLSELLIHKCCQILAVQDIERLNLGGSETARLDAYKRKFQPVISIALNSIEVKMGNAFFAEEHESFERFLRVSTER